MDPIIGIAGSDVTGRACPYCRFALKEGVDLATCQDCGAPHHEECWEANAGCAMVGCASGPQLGQTAAVPIETTGLPAVPEGGPAGLAGKGKPIPIAPYGDAQTPAPAKSSRGMVAAVLVLALAVGAAGAAIFTSQRNDALPATTDAVATDSNLTTAPVVATTRASHTNSQRSSKVGVDKRRLAEMRRSKSTTVSSEPASPKPEGKPVTTVSPEPAAPKPDGKPVATKPPEDAGGATPN